MTAEAEIAKLEGSIKSVQETQYRLETSQLRLDDSVRELERNLNKIEVTLNGIPVKVRDLQDQQLVFKTQIQTYSNLPKVLSGLALFVSAATALGAYLS